MLFQLYLSKIDSNVRTESDQAAVDVTGYVQSKETPLVVDNNAMRLELARTLIDEMG